MEKMSYEDFAEKYLSGDVKDKFMANLIKAKRLGEGARGFHYASQFIECAFCWDLTPEPHGFWVGIASALRANPKCYAPKPKITIGQAADKYLSGEIKERFLDAMEAENDLGLDAEVDDNPSTLISSSFIWEDTKEGGKFWIDVANAIFKNPMFYAPKPGQTFRDFAKKYLSGDIYERFINNCVTFNSQDYLDRVPTSIKEDSVDYFYAPFVWSDSPEGHDYWSEAAEKFKKDTTVFQFKPYVWVVFSEDSMRLLDVFSSEEEATKCWDGCSGYVIKKFVQAEV